MATDGKAVNTKQNQSPIKIKKDDDRFIKIIRHLSRQSIDLCFHCYCCGGGCPFANHMELLPNQVLRLIQYGQIQEALSCNTIWVCVGCHTCSSQCPNNIDIASMMDALRQLAIREGITPAENEVFKFHKYIYGSIQKHGRLNKLEAMAQYKLGTGQLFSDIQIGFRMLTRGKLELLSQNVKARSELQRIFAHYDKRRRSFDQHE